uniref:Uncharacterized protein n=1 Tax=Picea sitchensis TaxID=3332 RepID=A9NTR5_PICSI|nr:unknown [Picea sitchensis]
MSFLLLSGYPTQAPPPQYAESSGPVKTQQRGDKGFVEGCYEFHCNFSLLSKYIWGYDFCY